MSTATVHGFSDTALRYFASRAIDPDLARRCGVRSDDRGIVWPTVDENGAYWPRRRFLNGECDGMTGARKKVRPKWTGRSPGPWWPLSRPDTVDGWDVLVCEGESDTMAAASVLRPDDRVHPVEGKACKVDVLADELRAVGARVACLAFDGDTGGAIRCERTTGALISAGIGVRVLSVPHGNDLASVLAGIDTPDGRWPHDPRAWLLHAMTSAAPVGLEVAALRAENAWLWQRVNETTREW